jgi:hypothetical protein
MGRARWTVGLVVAGVLALVAASAQGAADSKGTDFWLTFPGNAFCCGTPTLSLFITGQTATTGAVEIPGLGFSTPFSVTPGSVTTVAIPVGAHLTTSDMVETKGIHVTAQAEVSVYGLSRIQASTDAFLGLPTDILGTEYIILGYRNGGAIQGSEFAVVATMDGTTVTITPAASTGARMAGVPYNVALNQGQTYQLINTVFAADLSGTIITSDKPIAAFGGHNCANIPPGFIACDHVVEQLPPTVTWGKNFVTMPLATRTGGDTFRFLASTDGTQVSVNGSVVATLNRGQIHERIITGPAQIISTEPILVAQYSNSSSFDGMTSDPFMMLIPPFEQFLASYTVTTPATGFATNFINVVVPNAAVGSIMLDGAAIPAGSFTPIGSTGFSGAQVAVTVGSHNLSGPLPFGAFMYGFASFDSYGYPGGMSLAPVVSVTDIALAPKTGTNPVNTQHCVVATVTDQNENPVEGVRVDFNVTGANPTAGFDDTDVNGQAQFCYTGTTAGTDMIVASVGTISDDAQKTWTAGKRGRARGPTRRFPELRNLVLSQDGDAIVAEFDFFDPEGDALEARVETSALNNPMNCASPLGASEVVSKNFTVPLEDSGESPRARALRGPQPNPSAPNSTAGTVMFEVWRVGPEALSELSAAGCEAVVLEMLGFKVQAVDAAGNTGNTLKTRRFSITVPVGGD